MDKYDEMNPVELLEEIRKLDSRINNPITDDFLEGVRNEAAHQVGRWGTAHDRGKTPLDWFWLVGYLAQKAAAAEMRADEVLQDKRLPDDRDRLADAIKFKEKALHHTISTAAALLNWHTHIKSRLNEGVRNETEVHRKERTRKHPG